MIKAEINKERIHVTAKGNTDVVIAEMCCFVQSMMCQILSSVPEEHRNEVANCVSLMMIETITDARKNAERS